MQRSAFGLVALLAPLAAAQAGEYWVGAGVEYGSGDYATDETASYWSLPLSFGFVGDATAFSVSVPYLLMHAPGDLVLSGSGIRRRGADGGQPASGTRTDSGLGDVTASGSVQLAAEGPHSPWLGVTGKVKFGTADAGLGTGENDYALQLEAAKRFLGGYAGYRWIGDPADTDYRDVPFAAVALDFALGESADWGVEYFWEAAALSDEPDKREASLLLGVEASPGRRFDAFLTHGLSDSSPDLVVGLNLSQAL